MDAIDTSVNARGAFISRNTPAWHGLGEVRPDWPMPQILAQPGISYRVELETLTTKSGKEVPDTFATVRTDTLAPLAVVGSRYTVIQHTDEFREFDSVLAPAGFVYETAGILSGGRDVFLLARRPEGIIIGRGDEVRPFILFRFSYDGKSSMTVRAVTERVVCANTLAIALRESSNGFSESIRHTKSADSRLQAIRATLQQTAQAFASFEADAGLLSSQVITPGAQKDVLLSVLETAIGRAPEASASDEALTKYRKSAEEILTGIGKALRAPEQNLPGMNGTRWQLLNAVTAFVDHEWALGQKGSARAKAERRFLSTVAGHGHDVKQAAFSALLAA